jgi:hypothetical protein
MGFNFNNNNNEYSLYNSLTSELINLYGFNTSYIKTEKVNMDVIFGEIQNLRADNSSIYNVSVYPENTAGFSDQNDILSKFGILSFDSINLYISSETFLTIYPDGNVQRSVGDLIVLPSSKVMEITELESQVPGINNMYVYNNQKNVYLLKCKPYNNNHDELTITNLPDIPDFGALFDIANTTAEKTAQNVQSPTVKGLDAVFGDLD